MTVAPDWCAEFLSPSTARDDRLLKLPMYASCGVEWSWLVDPDLRTVEVYHTTGRDPTLVATASDDDTVVLPPFDLPIAIGDWWQR